MRGVSTARTGRAAPWPIASLALVGVGISGYLYSARLRGAEPYCAAYGGCETVNNSQYATLVGIPISLLGLLSYLGILALLLVRERGLPGWHIYATLGLFLVSLLGFLFSVYLTLMELFVIDAVCLWCLASFAVITIIFALSLRDVLRERAGGQM